MQKHINTVLEFAENLRRLGEIIKDDNLKEILLCSLRNCYSTFIRSIECKNETVLSLKYVQHKIITEFFTSV